MELLLRVLGYNNAEQFFGTPEKAIGKVVSFDGHRVTVIGVIQKQGQGFGPGLIMIIPYYLLLLLCKYLCYNNDNGNPFIMVKGKPDVPSRALTDELKGVMRQISRLSPQAGR